MNTERPSDDVRRARAALAGLRPPPAPAAAFRARLRREFAAGTLAPADAVAAPRRVVRPALRWAGAAVAAAGIAAGTLALGNAGPAWRVVAAAGAGAATVDGRAVPLADAAALTAALVPGAHVRLPAGAALEIASARTLAIQMAGGTDAVVPRVPGRWFGRAVAGSLAAGEWRVTTGAAFPGARLAITTPSARVEVTGTTLAVICQPQGTCVCVFEGHVRVGRVRGDLVTVAGGRRRYVYADAAHAPLDDAMLPGERPALGDFCDAMRPLLHRPR